MLSVDNNDFVCDSEDFRKSLIFEVCRLNSGRHVCGGLGDALSPTRTSVPARDEFELATAFCTGERLFSEQLQKRLDSIQSLLSCSIAIVTFSIHQLLLYPSCRLESGHQLRDLNKSIRPSRRKSRAPIACQYKTLAICLPYHLHRLDGLFHRLLHQVQPLHLPDINHSAIPRC